MQSTGHTSTQAVSFVSIQGSVMINGISPFPPPGVRSYRKAAGFARTVWVVFRGRPPERGLYLPFMAETTTAAAPATGHTARRGPEPPDIFENCLLYTSDAADDLLCVD